MSKSTRIVFALFFSLSLSFSAFISFIRYMALQEFEISTGYYQADSLLPNAVHYLLFVIVLVYFVVGLCLRGKISLRPASHGIGFYFGNALLGISLAAYALFSIPTFFEMKPNEISDSPLTTTLLLLATLFSIAGVFFCIHNCLFPTGAEDKRVLFGLSIPLFAIMQVLYLYFEASSPINAPNKLLDQFTFVFIALYLLYELRVLLGQPRYAAECALGFMTMVFSAVCGFPSFIYMLVNGQPLYENAAHDVFMIAVFLYISIRMLRVLFSESSNDDKILQLLKKAEHPAASLSKMPPLSDEDFDELQLTFDSLESEAPEKNTEAENAQALFDVEESIPTQAEAKQDDRAKDTAQEAEEGAEQGESTNA